LRGPRISPLHGDLIVTEPGKIRFGSRQNAKVTGRRFAARFIEPGIVSYEDGGGDKEYLSKATLDKCCGTFVGQNVILRHNGKEAKGTIERVWWNPEDAWYWCEGPIEDGEATQRINEGWSVSCGYHITETNEAGGDWHAIPYVREILDFVGEHLAIVENPRYEGAAIRLNEKTTTKPGSAMFKFIKKILAPASTPDTAAKPGQADQAELSGDSEVTIDGAQVRLNDLVELHRQHAKTGDSLAPETQIEVDGKAVTIADVVAGFRANTAAEDKAKKDKDDEDEKAKKAKADKDDSDRKNAADDDEKKKKKDKEDADEKEKKDRENARAGKDSFRVLAQARNNAPAPQPAAFASFGNLSEQLERGKRLCSLETLSAGKN
jgi:hypothetical protein